VIRDVSGTGFEKGATEGYLIVKIGFKGLRVPGFGEF
jgi:hypothetical protein